MRKFNNPIKDIGFFIYRWITPLIDPLIIIKSLPNLPSFFREIMIYSIIDGSESRKFNDT